MKKFAKFVTIVILLLAFAVEPVCAGAVPNKGRAELNYTIVRVGKKYVTTFYDKDGEYVAEYVTKWKPKVKFFNTENYDYDKITRRTKDHVIYVEIYIGKVVNKRRDGKLLTVKPPYNYISYKYVRGAKKGKIIRTYGIYNPYNNYDDDVDCRIDYVVK